MNFLQQSIDVKGMVLEEGHGVIVLSMSHKQHFVKITGEPS